MVQCEPEHPARANRGGRQTMALSPRVRVQSRQKSLNRFGASSVYSADTVDVQRAARGGQLGRAAAHMVHHGWRTSWASRRALGWP
jgi:hypothetical protein